MSNRATVFMMTYVLHNLPTAKYHAWVCSSGSTGYCAVKEMLQNGIPGQTFLVESGDLRDVDASSEGDCLLIYCLLDFSYVDQYLHSNHIPATVRHVAVFTGSGVVNQHFLNGCTGLTTIDLSPLLQVTVVQDSFLEGCTGLSTLDLSPLLRVTEVQGFFLKGCTGLSTLDLSPLSHLKEVSYGFLKECTGLTTLDLSPLSQVKEVEWGFLDGCTGVDVVAPRCDPPSGWYRVADRWVQKD